MKKARRMMACLLGLGLIVSSVTGPQNSTSAAAASKKVKTKRYVISKKAGTYSSAINVTIKARKGYKVYYSTSGKFSVKKRIFSNKKKSIRINKTKTLSIYAVKSSAKVSGKKLKKLSKLKKSKYFKTYRYRIKKSDSAAASQTGSTAGGNTAQPGTLPTPNPSALPSGVTEQPSGSSLPDASGKPQETPPSGSIPPDASGKPDGTPPSFGTATLTPEGKSDAQEKLNETMGQLVSDSGMPDAVMPSVTPSVIEGSTAITLTAESMTAKNADADAVSYQQGDSFNTLTIQKAGTYVLSGGSSAPVTNTEIIVDGNITEEVNLIWDNLVIDNSAMGSAAGEDVPVFLIKKSTSNVHVTLKGSSVFTGNGTYTEKTAAGIICAEDAGTTLAFSAYAGDDTASLTVVDAMDADTDFGVNDPSDGIYSKGTLVMNGGTYSVTVNGDCLKGTGKNGAGGIWINDGKYTLHSAAGNGLKSKNGNIDITGGTIQSKYTAEDGINAKNYDVIITGGTITIDQCYGDGIQGENVNISGDDTVIDIKTYYENAGTNYYNSALGSGNYNTLSETESSKTEVVNVDTGSHKGIKGGTKACTYSYRTVAEGSTKTAGETYTTEASGGIIISGGTIRIDTTHAGIKYNGGGGMGIGTRPGGSTSSTGNLSAASDGRYIIGSPDDGIHSNNTCVIAGGTLQISSSDDGITAPAEIIIMNGTDITIDHCYEGIESGEIIIGSSDGQEKSPAVKIYSDDDGVNASSKLNVNYVYADESEEKYTKTQTSSNDNTLTVLDGYLNVMIGDDTTHSFSLDNADGSTTTGSYSSDGDGIDCNGAFYAYGGTIIVFGANSEDNSPIDTDSGYYIGSGVTLLAVGKNGMAESPAGKDQPVVVYGESGGMGSMGPGQGGSPGGNRRVGPGGSQGGNSSFSANTAFAIMKGQDTVLAIKPIKTYNYVLYSSPELESGSEYTMYSGGSVSGSLVQTDSTAYDYRYTGYDTSGAAALSTVTAQN